MVPNQSKFLNAFDLKIIALITMLIDHLGIMFFPHITEFRILGRTAFVLYAFMLAEGLHYTSNTRQYLTKLGIWALLSEPAFDLAISGKLTFESQNIFFTLFVSAAAILIIKNTYNFFIKFIVVLAVLVVSALLNFDYSWYGPAIIMIFYFLRPYKIAKFIAVQILSLIFAYFIFPLQIFAFFGLLPILFYSGLEGRKMGEVYYSFYALHLIIFLMIKSCLYLPTL